MPEYFNNACQSAGSRTRYTVKTMTPDLQALDGRLLSVIYADASGLVIFPEPITQEDLDLLHDQWKSLGLSRRYQVSDEARELVEELGVGIDPEPAGICEFGDDPEMTFGAWRQLNAEHSDAHFAWAEDTRRRLRDARSRLFIRAGGIALGDFWLEDAMRFSDDDEVDGYGSGKCRLIVRDDVLWGCGSDGSEGYMDLDAALATAREVDRKHNADALAANLAGVAAMTHLELFGITSASEFRGEVPPDEVLALTAVEFAEAAEARRAEILTTALNTGWGEFGDLVSGGRRFVVAPAKQARGYSRNALSRLDVGQVEPELAARLFELLVP
jgi:hypothetical protein